MAQTGQRSSRPAEGGAMTVSATEAEVGLSAPETKAGRLQRACFAWLKQHEREGTIPTIGRFLFYELEQQGVIPKHYVKPSGEKRARTPAQDIADATLRLRKLGLVPWDWILDESRDVTTWRYAESVYETSPTASSGRGSTVGA